MSDNNSGNGNGALYFIVGALVVAVAVGGFFMFGGNVGGSSTASAPAPATAPAAAPTETKKIIIEKVEPERKVTIERK